MGAPQSKACDWLSLRFWVVAAQVSLSSLRVREAHLKATSIPFQDGAGAADDSCWMSYYHFFFLLMVLFWVFFKENLKPFLIPKPSPLVVETNVESTYEVVELGPDSREQKLLSHTSGSQEDEPALGTLQSSESSFPSGQGIVSDRERRLEAVPEGLDTSPTCSEMRFDSNVCVHNYSIQLTRGLLEKSAQTYSTLQGPTTPDQGTVRRMAWSMVE